MKKKKKAKKISQAKRIAQKLSFDDVRFDHSLVMVFLAALVFLISFLVYSSYDLVPIEEYELAIEEPLPPGDECVTDSTCPQPRCPGVKGFCENGYCVVRQVAPSAVKCFDLKAPICGNNVCEGGEMERCPEDCGFFAEPCNYDGRCEPDLMELYPDEYSENEHSGNCPDCFCGDGICDDYEREKGSCSEDCA